MGKKKFKFNASLFPNLDPLEKVLLVVSHFNGLGWVGSFINLKNCLMKAFVNFHGNLTSFQFTHVP
jgi:hypothetical protein